MQNEAFRQIVLKKMKEANIMFRAVGVVTDTAPVCVESPIFESTTGQQWRRA